MSQPETSRSLTEDQRTRIRSTYAELQANTPGFAVRRSQSHMIGIASRALGTTGGVALIEAGTGVGKSLGYLTPGVPLALDTGRKLVLSTGTVALQSQLYDRDVPAFLKATGINASVALLKGRARYFCPFKASGTNGNASGGQDELFGDIGPLYEAPLSGSDTTIINELIARFELQKWDGDLDNPPVPVPPSVRPHVSTNASGCIGRKCPFVGACPALKARKTAQDAQIVVVNHALLLSALELAQVSEEPMLGDPMKMIVVLDEGHHLPSIAIDTGAASIALSSSIRKLVKLPSVMARVYSGLEAEKLAHTSPPEFVEATSEYSRRLRMLKTEIDNAWTPDPGEYEAMWRAPLGELPMGWAEHCEQLLHWGQKIHNVLEAASSRLQSSSKISEGDRGKFVTTVGMFAESMAEHVTLWSTWAKSDVPGAPPNARWITLTKDATDIICHCSPSSAGQLLRSLLWGKVDSVVVTSATISAGGNFDGIATEMGVPSDAEMVSLPSPFDLPNQAKLYVPRMRSTPQDRDAHTREVVQYIDKNLDLAAGSIVLFTAKTKMKAVFDLLPTHITSRVLVQGQEPVQQLVKRHIERIEKGEGSIIFGMQSVGEGLDLKGKYCTNVVITQLPFPVPTDPIIATLSEWYESRKLNSFAMISVPHAIRVLTQFAGRLIRTATDTGSIHLLDSRLLTKGYGKRILGALPPFGRSIG
ncbi:ATP-dependent DNA helicase DinG [Xanthomonas perforans]|uniref:ATP-dependent DNA helicase DinG n=2 Tax=Xanthomonas perforans TaxID=442694 RepID=A0ABR5EM76_XANPE|nr:MULTISPECIES: ATP-dependent DNA helicase DinG [Xanthomonas]KLC02068.1 ATP-dependent DNA helicase DinG [Xanthomonas perforans]KLC11157.1 ATP-dependent DNA helicase DinG [Xanthomonas perforans]KLC15453.1 ATP-dependent DNA helicase DinG [Xanthomonas perforans]KLC36711.1 ATP-dependent DNA helicase DinG [Xanthomonas perforans]KLC40603.1 ATP-dependent DNA helicase DinG [Xanthomonas perforans]